MPELYNTDEVFFMDYEKVIEELQGGQMDLKRLMSIMSANYIALCQSTEELKKTAEELKKSNEQNKKEHEDFCRTFLELQIQQKIISEENNYLIKELKDIKDWKDSVNI